MWQGLCSQPDQKPVAISDLRPTQIAVGMREIGIKRKRWRKTSLDDFARFQSTNSIPAILGPDERLYIIDRHHLARALSEEGVMKWPIVVVADDSRLDQDVFWAALESRNWTHPFDDNGRRRNYNDLPKSISDLVDDPYRSLAGALKRAGVYRKDKAPFSEFRWANFLRSRLNRKILDRDFEHAILLAARLAVGPDARLLPGYLGTLS
jgi:hypothetical protein